MTDEKRTTDGRVRPLRRGQVMAVYMDFDRHADKTLSPAEYLLRFGEAVSAATATANQDRSLALAMRQWDSWKAYDERWNVMDDAYNGGWLPMNEALDDAGPVLLLVPIRLAKRSTHIQTQGEWWGSYWVIFNADEAVQRVEPISWRPLVPWACYKPSNVRAGV